MGDDEAAALHLALRTVPGVGPVAHAQLLTAYGSLTRLATGTPPERGWDVVPPDLDTRLVRALTQQDAQDPARDSGMFGSEGPAWRRPLERRVTSALPAARAQVARARRIGLAVLCREDPTYPVALVECLQDKAPAVLFVAGTLPPQCRLTSAELASVAVVGARAASDFSLSFAFDLAAELAAAGLVVVSGLALGVDAAAHEGALSAGVTVAVLGGGHARPHPRSNDGLSKRIVRGGGAVISEWPPDVNPQPSHFTWRNRIVSGLSRAVVVVEAAAKSGALWTVNHALGQGRTVLAVPDRPDSVRAAGNLALIRDGATPLLDVSDALALFDDVESVRSRFDSTAASVAGNATAVAAAAAPAASAETATAAPTTPAATSTDALVVRLMTALAGGGWHLPETLARELAEPPQALLAALTSLELSGQVERRSGRYRRHNRTPR